MSTERNTFSIEQRYRLLLEISRSVRASLDLEEILEGLLDSVRSVVAYDAAGIFVLSRGVLAIHDHDTDHLIAGIVQRGFDARPPDTDLMLTRGDGIVGHVIRTGESLRVPDVRRDPRYVVGRARTLSEIAVPILRLNEPVGALNLESDREDAFDEEDVEILRFIADAAAGSIERAMLHRQLMARRRIEDQMRLAHEVQLRLLPDRPPRVSGYDLAGLCIPTFDIGGDYFDYIPIDEDRLGLVVADVSGKGIPAALNMTSFRSLIRTHAQTRREPSHLANRINELLPEATGETAYVTCVYAILELQEGRLGYTNCGHNPPLVARADGSFELLESGGLPLGLFTDSRYEPGEVTLLPGDVVVFYTDGVVETQDASEAEFGLERLRDVVRSSRLLPAHDLIQEIARATRAFSGAASHDDDFTVMVVRRNLQAA